MDNYTSKALADKTFEAIIKDIISNPRFEKLSEYAHHHSTRYDHCIHVAYSCYLYLQKHTYAYWQDTVQGALLHDFFLYAYQTERTVKRHWLHGLFHPKVALITASSEFILTPVSKNIILRHMFPLTPIPPVTKGGWLVVLYDKIWAIRELNRKWALG